MKYRFIDHTADIAAELEGRDMNGLFTAAAYAFKEAMIEEGDIRLTGVKVIELSEDSAEELLVYFADELNYLVQTKKWLPLLVKSMSVVQKDDGWHLKCSVEGEAFDPARHALKIEIKAVTFHQMDIKFEEGVYRTRIVFDI